MGLYKCHDIKFWTDRMGSNIELFYPVATNEMFLQVLYVLPDLLDFPYCLSHERLVVFDPRMYSF